MASSLLCRPALVYFPGKQLAVFRYFSVRLRRREGEKRKTPYGGSTRVLGEPAAVLYRLGSIINHWNSRNKKSRGFFRCHYYHRARCRKEKTVVCDGDCGSLLRKRCDEAMQKRSRSLGSFRARIPLIGLCGVGCRDTDARASLRCAMRAGAGSARRPSSARGASRRRRRTPQTGSATQPVPPGAPCAHGAAPGQQQPANNPVLLPLSAALGGLSVPSGVARAPRSAVHPPSAAAAGLSAFRQQVVQLAGWQRDMPSGGSSIIRRCTAGTS